MIGSDANDYGKTSKVMEVNPRDLRFTQLDIRDRFKPPHENVLLREAVDKIKKGLLNPSSLCPSPLKVYKDEEGIMWCENNRRLWVLRKAGVSSVPVKFKSKGYKVRCLGNQRERVSDPNFYPEVRGGDPTANDPCSPLIPREILSDPQICPLQQQWSVFGHFVTVFKLLVKLIYFAFRALAACFFVAALVVGFVALLESSLFRKSEH